MSIQVVGGIICDKSYLKSKMMETRFIVFNQPIENVWPEKTMGFSGIFVPFKKKKLWHNNLP